MIRVVLAIRPESFRQLVREWLAQERGVRIVGEASTPLELLFCVAQTNPDFVVMSWDDGTPPGICSHLLAEFPDLKIIGICSNPDRLFICRNVVQTNILPDNGMTGVLSAMRRGTELPFSREAIRQSSLN